MKKLAKWIGIIVALVVVLLVAAVFILPSLIPIDTVKERVVAQVKSATGRDLRIDGPVSFSVLPRLEVQANQVSLSNVPGAQSKSMVQLGRLDVQLELLALLHGTVAIDTFVLNDPIIALEVDKQGRPNWEFTAAPAGGQAAAGRPATGGTAPSSGSVAGVGRQIQLGDVRLVNGKLTYVNDQTGGKWEVDAVNMTVVLPNFDSPLAVNGSAAYRGKTISMKLGVAKLRELTEKQGTPVQASASSEMFNLDFKGQAAMTAQPTAGGTVDLSIPSLRKLAAWAGTPLAEQGEGFGPFSIKGKLGMKGDQIAFTEAQISLDSIKGTGAIDVVTGGAKPAISGTLALESLNLNPYLPPESKAGAAGGGAGGGSSAGGGKAGGGWSDEPIDVSGLKTANVDFKLSANAIQVRKIHVDKSALGIHIKDGHLTADLTDLSAYQGGGTADVAVDGSGAEPAITIAAKLANVQVEPLAKDAIDLDRLSGKGNLDFSVAGHGKSQRAIISALNGKGAFHLADGEIKGLDLLKMLNAAATNVTDLMTNAQSGNTTKFSTLSATFTITSGVMHNSDLDLEGPGLAAQGAGTVDLPQRRVDYKVTPKVAGMSVPVNVEGPWDNLSYRPDLAALLKGGVGGATNTLKGLVPGLPGSGTSQPGGSQPGGSPSGSKPSNPADALKNLFK
jgi:AsmA protein